MDDERREQSADEPEPDEVESKELSHEELDDAAGGYMDPTDVPPPALPGPGGN